MQIPLEYYKVFYYSAKYGSFTAAAQALFTSQSTVSVQIKALERELGCALFVRTRKGAKLTPEGEFLYAHVAEAMEHVKVAEEELDSYRNFGRGVVRIGASETTIRFYLLPFVTAFREKYPDIKVKIFNYSTPEAEQAVTGGLADFAVVTSPAEAEGLRRVPLAEIRDICIAGNRFAGLIGKRAGLAELGRCPFICLAENTGSRKFLDRFFLDWGAPLAPDMELATSDLILPMVESNLGLGFVPEPFAEKSIEEGKVFRVELDREIPPRKILLLTGRAPLSRAAETFIRLLPPLE